MNELFLFSLIGLASGVTYAAVGLGVVVTYRGTGVINFATGTMGMWGAFVFDELNKTGDLVLPIVVIPHRIHIGDDVGFPVAIFLAIASCVAIGLVCHFLVFRPLRTAPVLAKVVASVGILLTIQSLVVMHFSSTPRSVAQILPAETVSFGGTSFPRDRLWLTLVVSLLGIILWAFFRYTKIGLATRASAENERAVSLTGYSPQILAAGTWVISSIAVAAIIILGSPSGVLSPLTYTFAIVPALAAALVGRMQSISITVIAGLFLGSFSSVIQNSTSKSWWPSWAVTGITDAVPFLVITVALFAVGKSLPSRGAVQSDPLPEVVRPLNRPWAVCTLFILGLIAMSLLSGGYRFGLITSLIVSMIMLSFVVLTGFIGQISLAQASVAGTAGFALSKFATNAGIPFPVSMLLASLVAVLCGVIIGIPALRIRGVQLAVVTLAGAVALEKFIFRNPSFSSTSGNMIPDISFLGLDFPVQVGRDVARWSFGVVVLVVLTVLCVLVANLAKSATGRRFLAVRSNERAAASVGINVSLNKLLAFAIASFLAGIGGSFIGYSRGQLSADSFAALVGISFLAFAYLGGITSVSGALVAGLSAPLGLMFIFIDRNLNLATSYGLIGGIGLILTAIFNPIGIAGATRQNVAPIIAKIVNRIRNTSESELPTESTSVSSEYKNETLVNHRAQLSFDDAEVVLSTEKVTVKFGGLTAVNEANLTVKKGQIVGLIGPNGAGKTTLIDAITGFVPATGNVQFGDAQIAELSPYLRSRLGLRRTWQSLELFTDLTVGENLAVAREVASVKSVVQDFFRPSRAEEKHDIDWALDLVGLLQYRDMKPSSLSLGQQKLLGVARALVVRPHLVLLDEPAAGLDTREGEKFGAKLLEIADQGMAVFLIDHDMGLVLNVCDYIYVLDFGNVIAEGTPSEIRSNQVVVGAYLGQDHE